MDGQHNRSFMPRFTLVIWGLSLSTAAGSGCGRNQVISEGERSLSPHQQAENSAPSKEIARFEARLDEIERRARGGKAKSDAVDAGDINRRHPFDVSGELRQLRAEWAAYDMDVRDRLEKIEEIGLTTRGTRIK